MVNLNSDRARTLPKRRPQYQVATSKLLSGPLDGLPEVFFPAHHVQASSSFQRLSVSGSSLSACSRETPGRNGRQGGDAVVNARPIGGSTRESRCHSVSVSRTRDSARITPSAYPAFLETKSSPGPVSSSPARRQSTESPAGLRPRPATRARRHQRFHPLPLKRHPALGDAE
jgi:hypothetical protein